MGRLSRTGFDPRRTGTARVAARLIARMSSGLGRGPAWSRRRRAAARALSLVAAGAPPLGVTAPTPAAATAAGAMLGRPHLGRGDGVQGPALEVVKERVAAVGHA